MGEINCSKKLKTSEVNVVDATFTNLVVPNGKTLNYVLEYFNSQINGLISGSNPIAVKDEGSSLTSNLSSLNFTGAGVTASVIGNDVTVNIDASGTTPGVYVPYTGATANVNIGTNSIIADNGTYNSEMSSSYFGVENTASTIFGLLEYNKLTITDNTLPSSMEVNATGLKFPNGSIQTTAATGTVTSVSALTLGTTGTDVNSSVATGTTTPVITLNIPTASATNRGALSSADWNMFSGKVDGSGTINYVPKFTAPGTLGDSNIYSIGTNTGIGVTTPISRLHISSVDKTISNTLYTSDYITLSAEETAPGFNIISSGSSVGNRGVLKATRSRGTLDTPTAVISGDNTLSIVAAGHDGTTNLTTAGITFLVDGAVSTNVLPQAITFATGAGSSRTERMRINSTGQVGINVVPSAASATFTVKSTATPSAGESIATFQVSDASSSFSIQNASNSDGVFIPSLVGNQTPGINQQALNLTGYINSADDTGTNPIMTFRSALTSLAPATTRPLFDFRNWGTSVMTIAASGNVGIGTTTPVAPLHVRSTAIPSTTETIARFDVSDDTSSYIRFLNGTATDGVFSPYIEGKNSSNTTALGFIGNGTTDTGSVAVTSFNSRIGSSAVVTRPVFQWGNYTTSLMTMLANGNLGIGTITPGTKLEVNGDIKISTIANATTDTDRFLVSDGGVIKYRTGAEMLSDVGAQGSITLTTTGTSGAATLVGNTLNIPQYSGGVGTGTVTSVDLSMPSAFTVSNSPITSSGTIAVTGSGTTSDYIRGDGSLATFPTALPTANVKHSVKYAVALTIGQAVYVSSADGTNMIVSKADNSSEATSSKTMGLVTASGAANYQGEVITEGLLAGLDTSTATVGDAVWLGTNGNLIFWHYGGPTAKPVAPAHLVFIGIVTRVNVSNGEIFVKVQNGIEIDEIHDVSIVGRANNTILGYNSSTSLHEFKTASTWLGYTPANIAGDTFTGAISATNLSGTNTGDETTATIKTKLGAATSSADGYLTSTDWSTFNGKVNGSGTANYLSKFTASGTIGNSLIQDNGTNLGISTAPVAGTKVTIQGSTGHGLRANTTGDGKYGLYGSNVNDGPGTFVGVYGEALDNGGRFVNTTWVGGKFFATNGVDQDGVYSLWLQDGTESTGRFLKSITADGKANWATMSVADTGLAVTTTGSGEATLVGNTLNIPSSFIPSFKADETYRGININNNSTTVISEGGVVMASSASTLAQTVASTNFATKQVRLRYYASTVSGGRYTGTRGSALLWFIHGGFRFVCDFNISDTAYSAGCQQFYGMSGVTTDLNYGSASNILVSTLLNIIGVGSEVGDANLQIFHNDGSGTATKVDLGAGFPANRTAGAISTTVYGIQLYNEPMSTDVKYEVINKETGAIAKGTVSTNLPLTSQGLNFFATRCMSITSVTNTGQFDLMKLGVYSI